MSTGCRSICEGSLCAGDTVTLSKTIWETKSLGLSLGGGTDERLNGGRLVFYGFLIGEAL
jgi:hypothetical protein